MSNGVSAKVAISAIMTQNPLFVSPDTPLTEAASIMLKHGFSGLPVVDEKNRVVGILTDYDLILKGSSLHLPTLLRLLTEFEIYKKDQGLIKNDIGKIISMKVRDAMNPDPLTLRGDSSVEDVMHAYLEHHRVNTIPVLDADGRLSGIVSRSDLIKLLGVVAAGNALPADGRQLDENVTRFLKSFERKFILVSRFRTRRWLLASLLFAIVGFIIAFLLIIRIG